MNSRILIVEDSASLALTCRLHLEGRGHTLLEASDGQTALDILRDQRIDCILLDLDLPDMNGADILRLVRDFPTPPAVVVVTGRNSAKQAERAVSQGAFDFLVKPFGAARLVTTVRNALAQAEMKRELAARLEPTKDVRVHRYEVRTIWTGNLGSGTSSYRAYSRDHMLGAHGRPPIATSSDPAFRGDATRWNPEQLLVASASSCHQLWYLHLCAEAGVVVLGYTDDATGTMTEEAHGGGQFTEICLHPVVTIRPDSDPAVAAMLHTAAHEKCFIANSLNFPVRCEPRIIRPDMG